MAMVCMCAHSHARVTVCACACSFVLVNESVRRQRAPVCVSVWLGMGMDDGASFRTCLSSFVLCFDYDCGPTGVVTPEEFVEHATAQEACDAAGGCKSEDMGTEEQDAAAGMPSEAQIKAAKADVAAQFASGKAVKMRHDNTAGILDGTRNVMIKFSTSWCGHCVKMEPDWQRLAKLVHSDFKGCLVVSVDCEATADLCQAFSVQGYPTIMLLQATQVPPDKHKRLGTRLPLLCPYSCVTHF